MTVERRSRLADLLAGCGCPSCASRRPRSRATKHRPPAWTTPEMQLEFYGYAVIERTVAVH